jgi:cytochrome c oxidase subunit II
MTAFTCGSLRAGAMSVAVVLVLVALGSVLFHALSPWWWTPIASNWGYIDTTLVITFWITGIVFVAVVLFTAYCVFRFRHREGRRSDYEPENRRLEVWLTGLTAVGVAALLAPGLIVWKRFVTPPDDAVEVEVFAQQWRWSFRLPGGDGRLGRSHNTFVSFDNPLGLDPEDAAAADDIIIDGGDLHLLVEQPVKLMLRSADVLHNFYVPEFRGKMDMVPGMVTFYWFNPTRTGEYEALCAELCGVGHPFMRGFVQVVEEDEYQTWLAEQMTFSEMSPPPQVGALAPDR